MLDWCVLILSQEKKFWETCSLKSYLRRVQVAQLSQSRLPNHFSKDLRVLWAYQDACRQHQSSLHEVLQQRWPHTHGRPMEPFYLPWAALWCDEWVRCLISSHVEALGQGSWSRHSLTAASSCSRSTSQDEFLSLVLPCDISGAFDSNATASLSESWQIYHIYHTAFVEAP